MNIMFSLASVILFTGRVGPYPVADLRGALPAYPPPHYGPKFSQYHAVFWKNFGKIVGWCYSWKVGTPPTVNPGSAPDTPLPSRSRKYFGGQ